MQIAGTAAIVTGAASGLGAATARALAEAGAKVALLDIKAEALADIARDLGGIAVTCDVTQAASAEAALAQARQAHGAARICVNCAGIATASRIVGKTGPMPLEEFARVINVNLIGSFNVMRLAAADMLSLDPLGDEGERGVIINTASIAAFEGQIGQAAYAASKGGIVALTLPAAREFAKSGIRVNAIAPGIFDTPMMAGMPPEVYDSLVAQTLFPKRLGKPDDFAALALHIAQNTMINGEVIRLDGALRMEPR